MRRCIQIDGDLTMQIHVSTRPPLHALESERKYTGRYRVLAPCYIQPLIDIAQAPFVPQPPTIVAFTAHRLKTVMAIGRMQTSAKPSRDAQFSNPMAPMSVEIGVCCSCDFVQSSPINCLFNLIC